MNAEWDLTALYAGFDDPKFLADAEQLKTKTAAYTRFADELPKRTDAATAIHEGLQKAEEIIRLAYNLYGYCELRGSTDATNPEIAGWVGKIQEQLGEANAADAALTAYLAGVEDLDALIDADEFLQGYSFLLHEDKANAAHVLSGPVEQAMAKLNLSGGNGWQKLQQYLTSTAKATYRGKELTLTELRNLAYDKDPAVRKEAYEAELACYEKIKDGVCFSLNNLKKQLNTVSELRGEISPLERILRQSRLQKSTLDAMLASIEEYLPWFHKYLRAKAKALGYEGGLKWYDLFAPMGENTATYTVEDAKAYLLAHFRPFAPDIAELMERAFDENWIDFYPHDGKVGGAFCSNQPFIGQSRVLTNFDGSFGDIVTLAHELGHAYHGSQIESHLPLNMEYSMPVAETASTFNETVVMEAALREAKDDKVKLGLLESQLQDTTQIMCDILSRYWFESAVVEKSRDGFMFPDELCEMMLQAQKRAYGDGLDADSLNKYMWVCKSHYYDPSLPFYNFPYAFGGLFATGLYAQYLKEGESFLPKYRRLLHATTVSTAEDVAAMADIDLSKQDFWRSSLEIYKNRVQQFLELVEK